MNLFSYVIIAMTNGDLIGYNRLGNNIYTHTFSQRQPTQVVQQILRYPNISTKNLAEHLQCLRLMKTQKYQSQSKTNDSNRGSFYARSGREKRLRIYQQSLQALV